MEFYDGNKVTLKPFYISLTVISAFLLGLIFSTNDTFDKADGLWHFMLARYSFENPAFLLDLWGKPVFTGLAAAFAQFGFKGVHFLQLIYVIISCISVYRIALRYNLSSKILIPVLIAFSPVFLPLILSSMTEILFGTIIILGAALVIENRYVAAAIVISFAPYSRQEGFMIILIFFWVYMLHKELRKSLLLLTGTLFFVIVGGIVHKDLLWLIHQHPYSDASMYGHGELLHYVNAADEIFGTTASILGLLGALISLFVGIKHFRQQIIPSQESKLQSARFYLLTIIPVLFFCIHSFVWYKGWSGSLGLHRIMACIIPLLSVQILFAITAITSYGKKIPYLSIITTIAIGSTFIYGAITQKSVPLHLGPEEEVVYEAGKWSKNKGLSDKHFFYSHPYFIMMFDFNPYTSSEKRVINYGVPMREIIKPGDLVLWDAHFGPNECGTPLAMLKDSTNYRELKCFLPAYPFTVLGNHNFEVYLFEKK
jgi:hypothetical protein